MRVAGIQKNLFFSYEQGRDLLIVKEITEGNLTLLGPRTNIEGIFHGPLFYYLMVPFYLFFSGNPLGVTAPFILFGLGCVYLAYLVGKSFFNQYVGLIAALLYAISYEAIVYSRWLSNPPLACFFSLLLFYSLHKIATGDSKFLVLAVLAFAGIFHSEVAAAIFLLPAMIIIWLWFKPKIKDKKIKLVSFFALLFAFSSYWLFELRHQFLFTKSILRFLRNKENIYRPSIGKVFQTVFDRYVGEFQAMVFPANIWIAALIFLGIFLVLILEIKKSGFFSKKAIGEKILFLWLISAPTLGLFIWGGVHLKYYLVAVAPAMVIAAAFFIYWFIRQESLRLIGLFLLAGFLISNLYVWQKKLPKNEEIFYLAPQPTSLLGLEKKVIDFIYHDSAGKEFSYHAFAIPYEMEHAWEYLFWWYGQKEYHYLPAHTSNQPGLFYLIWEPGGDSGYRQTWKEKKVGEGKPLKTEEFEGILVETYFKR